MDIPSEGFQRFSVSHELGHYFLEGHIDQLLQTGVHVSRAGFVTADPYELEADHFAVGLLMPETPFGKEMENHEPGLAAVSPCRKLPYLPHRDRDPLRRADPRRRRGHRQHGRRH
jgi:Zn-dependent peptidase ImmA (M78 family)